MPELLSRLATESGHLVKDEIALAKQEIREKVVVLRTAVVLGVISVMAGFAALLALCGAAAAALAPRIGFWQALLVVCGGLVIISGIVAYISVGILRRTSLTPEQTVDTMEENKEWLKQLT